MDVNAWLELAKADAKRRGLDDLLPVLESLAAATRLLRSAPWNQHAAGRKP
jgi:hypothetical protein